MSNIPYYPDECHDEIRDNEISYVEKHIDDLKQYLSKLPGTTNAEDINAINAELRAKIIKLQAHYNFLNEACIAKGLINIKQRTELGAFLRAMQMMGRDQAQEE